MLPMMPILNDYMTRLGTKFELIPPRSDKLQTLFERSNWAHFIDPFRHPYLKDASGTHCPVLRFSNADEQFEVVDLVLKIILHSSDVSADALSAIEWSLNEITDNVLNHAGPDISGFVQATWFRENNVVEFVVADAGIGISASLGEKDHCLALEKAIEEGVTRDKKTNQGNGLYGSFRIAQIASGTFSLVSEFASLNLMPSGDVRIRSSKIPYKGTSVLWNMNTTKSDILSEALVFNGKKHEISYTFLDRLSEDPGGFLYIDLKAAFPSLGSRTAGDRVHTYLRNLLKNELVGGVRIDFSGVTVVSSSFADEVFGRLFVELGPIQFMGRVKLEKANAEILGLIDRAIVQRSASGSA